VLKDGSSEGRAAVYGSVVLLSAALQGFVEDVFMEASRRKLGLVSQESERKYRKTWDRWGNPSDGNITRLFQRLGLEDVFSGLSWSGQGTPALKKNLNHINQARNKIAHNLPMALDGVEQEIGYAKVNNWTKIARTFGEQFPSHVQQIIP
jgi:hypothetical protein